MSEPAVGSEERFAAIVEELLDNEAVTVPAETGKKMFGSATLKVDNKIFAMLVKGQLVVKLPKGRVDALIAAGEVERFDPGHGRLMKEWLAVPEGLADAWLPLAKEALEFVASRR